MLNSVYIYLTLSEKFYHHITSNDFSFYGTLSKASLKDKNKFRLNYLRGKKYTE